MGQAQRELPREERRLFWGKPHKTDEVGVNPARGSINAARATISSPQIGHIYNILRKECNRFYETSTSQVSTAILTSAFILPSKGSKKEI